MGWLLDPEETCLFVYRANQQIQVFEAGTAILPTPDFAQNLQLTTSDIFNWLQT